MKYYKTKYEIPVKNWFMIEVNNLDLNYMLKEPCKLTKKRIKILYEAFKTINGSLNFINHSMQNNYIIWQSYLEEVRALRMLNKDVNVKEMEQAFRNYLVSIEKAFNEFEITEHYFNENYIELFKEKVSPHLDEFRNEYFLKRLEDFKDIKFYTWTEFAIFAQKYPEMTGLFNSKLFLNEFIQRRILKVDSLIKVDNYLASIYISANCFNEIHEDRALIFDISRLKGKIRKEHDPFKDFSRICMNLGIPYNDNIPLSVYEGYIEEAQKKKEEPKPNAR